MNMAASSWANIVKTAEIRESENADKNATEQAQLDETKVSREKFERTDTETDQKEKENSEKQTKTEQKLDKKMTRTGSIIQWDSLRYLIIGKTTSCGHDYYRVRCVVQYQGMYFFVPASIDNWSFTGTMACNREFSLLVEKIEYKIKDLNEEICRKKEKDILCKF
jgi:hypothetical protein